MVQRAEHGWYDLIHTRNCMCHVHDRCTINPKPKLFFLFRPLFCQRTSQSDNFFDQNHFFQGIVSQIVCLGSLVSELNSPLTQMFQGRGKGNRDIHKYIRTYILHIYVCACMCAHVCLFACVCMCVVCMCAHV